MKLSVCIVLFNRWELSKRTIKSIADTVPATVEIEWCLIDNGSIDATKKELELFVQTLPGRAGYLESLVDAIPATQATNRPINAATGEWMLRIDNDIEMANGWFEDCMDIINDDKFQDVGFVCPTHHRREMDANYQPHLVHGSKVGTMIDMISDLSQNVPGNIFGRTSVIRDIGGFYTPYNLLHADVHYCMIAKHMGYKWGYTWNTLSKHIGAPDPSTEYSQNAIHERRSEEQRYNGIFQGKVQDVHPQEIEFAQQLSMMIKEKGKTLPKHHVNVLIPSCGRRVELVKMFKDVFKTPRWSGNVYTCGCDDAQPAAHFSDKHFIVPEIFNSNYIDNIIRLCSENDINYIFPVIDYDIRVLSKYKLEILRKTGTEVICLDEDKAEICNDKLKTYKFFKGLGIKAPATYYDEAVAPQKMYIVKPRYGFASKGIKITADLGHQIMNGNEIVQEYIEGQEFTCDLVSDRRFAVVSLVSRKRESVRGGEIQQAEVVNHLHLYNIFAAISRQLEIIGPWCIQYIQDKDDNIWFIEINSRFGGGVPISKRAGQDQASISLKVLERDFFGYHYRYLVEWGLTAMRFDDCFYKHIKNKSDHDNQGKKRLE